MEITFDFFNGVSGAEINGEGESKARLIIEIRDAANRKIIFGHPYVQSLSNVTKGTSNTILLGEKPMRPELYQSGIWFYDIPFFSETHQAFYDQDFL